MENDTVIFYLEIAKAVVTLLSALAIPIVLLVLGSRYTNARELEAKLRENRIEVYNKILEPFLLLFSSEAVIANSFRNKHEQKKTSADLASEKLLTLEYQQYAFKLSLFGSDDVLRAFNSLMQSFYNKADGYLLIESAAKLFLETRKSLGNHATKLQALEMLEWKMTDVTKFKVDGRYPESISSVVEN